MKPTPTSCIHLHEIQSISIFIMSLCHFLNHTYHFLYMVFTVFFEIGVCHQNLHYFMLCYNSVAICIELKKSCFYFWFQVALGKAKHCKQSQQQYFHFYYYMRFKFRQREHIFGTFCEEGNQLYIIEPANSLQELKIIHSKDKPIKY